MYNTDLPSRADLPTSAQLLRSTLIAAGVAAALLVTVVLPSEYGIDPTGSGRALGLTQMGEIKVQLQEEAEADRVGGQATEPPSTPPNPDVPEQRSGLLGSLFAQFALVGPAAAQTGMPAANAREISVTLKPSEAAEVKMEMKKGAKANYAWTVEGGTVNHDTHGAPATGGGEKSYSKGRSVADDKGVLTAAFDGSHGWFWRNRGARIVTVKLTASGEFTDLKRAK